MVIIEWSGKIVLSFRRTYMKIYYDDSYAKYYLKLSIINMNVQKCDVNIKPIGSKCKHLRKFVLVRNNIMHDDEPLSAWTLVHT